MNTKHSMTLRTARPHGIGLLLLAVGLSLSLTSPLSAAEPTAKALVPSEEFVGPFPSWKNLKVDFGATGDGKADDTAALQKALDQLQQQSGVLFLPAGTYRITKGLTMLSHIYVSVIGADPATTIIQWDGGDEGVMLFCNGVRYSKFGRITWDGGGKKVTAVYHEWDGHTPGAGTGNEHADEVFRDVAFGIRVGKPHFMDAESEVRRCKFQRVSDTGVRIQSFNALDWFIWDCEFEDCGTGVSNDPGAGHFHVYRSIFRRSKVADIAMRNAGYFSIRHNLSIGSNRFLDARDIGGWAVSLTVQNNTILDTKESVSMAIANPGPAVLLDNVIKSRAEVTEGPVVRMVAGLDGGYVAVGNTFTVPKPILARGQLLELETHITPAEKIVPIRLPGAITPQSLNRPVIDVPVKADAKALQAIIQQAVALKGQRPVVHLPAGQYAINETLTIPAGADLQLVGDGYSTLLQWTGSTNGTVFALAGPVRMTFRDLQINGGKATGLAVSHCDQPGARIYGAQLSVAGSGTGLWVDGLEQADVSLETFFHSGNRTSVLVAGGPKARDGKLTRARTVIFGGASSDTPFNYDVVSGGRLMAQDIWYEGAPNTFMKLTGPGTFTLNGAQIASGRPGPNAAPTDPNFAGVALDHFHGRATFLNTVFQTRAVVVGDDASGNLLMMGILATTAEQLLVAPPKAHVVMTKSRRFADLGKEGEPPTRPIPDQGQPKPEWLLQMLEQVRTDTPCLVTTIPIEATDLRFYRVTVGNCSTAIHLQAQRP